jgi:hypothetical protein
LHDITIFEYSGSPCIFYSIQHTRCSYLWVDLEAGGPTGQCSYFDA